MNRSEGLKKFFFRWEWLLAGIILLELAVFGALNESFLRPKTLFNSLNQFIPIAVIALFVTFVLVTIGIDIQAGALVGLTSILLGVLYSHTGLGIWAACLISVAAAALCGTLGGYFVAYTGVQPTVITFGGSFLYSGIALAVAANFSATPSTGGGSFPESFLALGKTTFSGGIPLQFVIFLAITLIAYFLLHKSKYGRQVYLCGQNRKAADISGIRTKRIIMSTYSLSGMSAGLAGVLLTSFLGTAQADLGSDYTLPVIAAVVLGGTRNLGGQGSIIGTALAALVIALLRIGLNTIGVPLQHLNLYIGALLIIVVAFRLRGKTTRLQHNQQTAGDEASFPKQP